MRGGSVLFDGTAVLPAGEGGERLLKKHEILSGAAPLRSSDFRLVLLLWALVFAERIVYMLLDPSLSTVFVADASNYYQSGLDFVRTGRIVYLGYPTALIMPGMPVLIGAMSLVFPEGPSLLTALQLLWIFMGSLVPVFFYRSLRLFTRRGVAFAAALIYLLPWHAEIDRFLLTECPNYLFFSMALFYLLRVGEFGEPRDVWRYAFSVLGALLFRANILFFVAFSFLYWLLVGRLPLRELLRRVLIVALVLGLFIVPWSVRNARVFHAFIPVTYGSGNPLFEGSYQGEDPPTDGEIHRLYPDYDVYAVLAQRRPDLLDAEGNVYDPEMTQYVNHLAVADMARVRLRGWWQLRPLGLLKTYLYLKPRSILNWVWYYIELFGISFQAAHRLRQLGFVLCLVTLVLARRRFRKQVWFLFLTYLINLFLVAGSYAIDRYAQTIMPYRYLIMGLGLELAVGSWESWREKHKPPKPTETGL